MVAVISYGVCNVGSILSMLKKIGVATEAVDMPAAVDRAGKIILPGIGAFDNGISALDDLGLVDPLVRRARAGVPFLGICLGMQLLGEGSEEGTKPGLGLVSGRSIRFRAHGDPAVKVPHMGWNVVVPQRPNPLLDRLDDRARFYFVHSYHLVCRDSADVLATTRYGIDFTSMVQRDNVWGAQFHPEKSHRYGMTLLSNFAKL